MSEIRYAVLKLVPKWFRSRWPMKRYYWQPEDLREAARKASELSNKLKWD